MNSDRGAVDVLSEGRSLFYQLVDRCPLVEPRLLPERPGLYFVFEVGEKRSGSERLRCVKVGKSTGNGRTIKKRIVREYFGKSHRAASVRMFVGDAILDVALRRRDGSEEMQLEQVSQLRTLWNVGGSPRKAVKVSVSNGFPWTSRESLRAAELPIEEAVTQYLQRFRFIGVPMSDVSAATIEHRANSLVSDCAEIDSPSVDWLGHSSNRQPVFQRGMWASEGVQFGRRHYVPYHLQPTCLLADPTGNDTNESWLGLLGDCIDALP